MEKKYENTKKYLPIACIILFAVIVIFMNTNVDASALDAYNNPPSLGEEVENEVKSIMGSVLSIVQAVGSVISVIALILIGMKYMLGSVEQKAEYKKQLMPYFVGSVILFAATNLASGIYDLIIATTKV